MIRLDAATVLLQWAAGGLFFLWFTTRRREVGVGYGWLLRGTYLLHGRSVRAGAGFRFGAVPVREASSIGVAVAAAASRSSCRSCAARPACRARTPSTTGAASAWRR